MSHYRESSNEAKAVRRGIVEGDAPHANRKKPKERGPWKVIGRSFGGAEYIVHHCKTKELAEKMVQKHVFAEHYRIEYQGDV